MNDYSITTDTRRGLLHIEMRGYWTQQIFDQFAAEYLDALKRMKSAGGLQLALVDGREFSIQAKEISEQFGALIASCKPLHARRTATVVPSHLNKLQAERAGGDLAARYFIDMTEARAWLFGAEAKAA
ncbi:hypothetical protein [Sphingobium nicotianae]|uniref:STAS/SEC14 domain-containing protein n=1 Tax=Sphingobium nicotianae TaxID=2782607 RepID=A0A9X1IPT7_9SPHN|nr:hypothetical protein [Sphingobium nicotianae]MBT2186254.1 hypothetical protein [Sphingobium nicotianae]